MNVSAVICAAGKGERAGFTKNKLLASLYGQPVIYTVCEKFYGIADEIIVVCAPRDAKLIGEICSPLGARTVIGGATRTESVYNALQEVRGEIVLVHDGARPFVPRSVIERCIDGVRANRSAICAVPLTDTVAHMDGGHVTSVPDRNAMCALQTPQGFYTEDLKRAYGLALSDGRTYTDDSSVYAAYIGNPCLCEGDKENIKLTFKKDFTAQYPALNAGEDMRAGFGSDVHALRGGTGIVLCGVKISCPLSLVAHSDGDVAVHAVMDALLSAAGLKDIGNYFPDTDQTFAGADSMKLLERVISLIGERGYAPANLSLTISAQTPRLSPYIDGMKKNLAAALGIPADCVGISAGTNEGLGFIGQKLGIAATACALIKRK